MGWDAYAIYSDGQALNIDWLSDRPRLVNFDLHIAFSSAAKAVQESAGTCDGYLSLGGLDVSTCGQMLELATGRDVYGDDWSSEQVEELYTHAVWDFDVHERNRWAYESAKAFLMVCAEHHLGVTFSW